GDAQANVVRGQVGRSAVGKVEIAEVCITVFGTSDEIVGEGVFEADAEGPAGIGLVARYEGSTGSVEDFAVQLAEGDAARDIGQEAVDCIAQTRAHGAFPVEFGVEGAGACESDAIVGAGPGEVGVAAENHVVGELIIVADIDATEPAVRLKFDWYSEKVARGVAIAPEIAHLA